MWGRLGVLATLMLATSAALPAGSASEGQPPAGPYEWSWAAPRDFEGTLTARVSFDFLDPLGCTFFLMLSGKTDAAGFPPVGWWIYEDHIGLRSALTTGSGLRVHGAGLDVSRDGGRSTWSVDGWVKLPDEPSQTWTIIGLGLAESHLPSPFGLRMQCDEPFAVTGIAGSQEAVGFLPETMGGGTGANLVAATAVVDDKVRAELVSNITKFVFVHFSTGPTGAGEVSVSHANGGFSGPFVGPAHMVADLSPGQVTVTMTYAGLDVTTFAVGMLYGVSIVSSLDEVL